MTDAADLSLDLASIDQLEDGIAREHLIAGTRTIRVVTRRTEQRLEKLTEKAAGGRLWRAWQSAVYPKGDRPARDPVGEIYIKGGTRTRGAIKFWTEPGRVKRDDGWLAVPLPAAGKRGRTGTITVREWEMAHSGWRLDMILTGRNALLVARKRGGKARPGSYSSGPRRGEGGVKEGQAIFALVSDVAFKNAVAVQPVLDQAEREIGAEFFAQVGWN